MNQYLCSIHKQMFIYNLVPMSPKYNICMNCLKLNIKGYCDPLQPVYSLEYNYIYPMICDSCSLSLKRCKWCRLLKRMAHL